MIKILIADKLSPKAVSALEALGAEVTVHPELKAEDLAGAIGDHEILIVRSTKVQAPAIDSAPNLSLIIRAGAGVNTIDLEQASRRGIHVANCPGKNTDAVAELAIGHIIAADRGIVNATCEMRAGTWCKKKYGKGRGLKGRTLAIIGMGAIGRAVARRAKGLDMEVIAWSRSLTPEKADELGVVHCESPQEAASRADVASVHLAATADTRHFINAAFFGAMNDGTIFVNTSRGEVVDTEALKKAVEAKGLKVGLDVYENEPAASAPEFNDPELAAATNCTPHIGASSDQAAEAIALEAVRVVQTYLETGRPVNAVNIQARSKAVINLVVRHYNRVGALAGVLEELRNGGINIEEMENHIFEGGEAACCTLKLDETPDTPLMEKIRSGDAIIQVMLK
jgi:D-3-phosphoglycerate dehydrogenase